MDLRVYVFFSDHLNVLWVALTLMLLVTNLTNTKLRKNLENDWNPGKWVLTWKYSARAFKWIPTWQGLDDFQKSLHPCVLDESSLSIGRVKECQSSSLCFLRSRSAWLLDVRIGLGFSFELGSLSCIKESSLCLFLCFFSDAAAAGCASWGSAEGGSSAERERGELRLHREHPHLQTQHQRLRPGEWYRN